MCFFVSEVPLYLVALFDKDQKAGAAFHELQVSLGLRDHGVGGRAQYKIYSLGEGWCCGFRGGGSPCGTCIWS